VDAFTINVGMTEAHPTETRAERREALRRLGEMVASSKAAFGVRFDPVGERISLVNEMGGIVDDERAQLVLLDLVAAEGHGGRIALPVTTTRVAERVAEFHGASVHWTTTSPDDLARVCGAGVPHEHRRVGRDGAVVGFGGADAVECVAD
jgi:mannose-1-phosphate guanylyltransferase/phosphomannomutase